MDSSSQQAAGSNGSLNGVNLMNNENFADNMYAQALRMYEQFSSLSNPSPTANILGLNPYLMAPPFGGLGPYSSMNALSGLSDYQSAASALAAGFPPGFPGLYAPLAFPGMPFSADYANLMAAYSLASSSASMNSVNSLNNLNNSLREREVSNSILRPSSGSSIRSSSNNQKHRTDYKKVSSSSTTPVDVSAQPVNCKINPLLEHSEELNLSSMSTPAPTLLQNGNGDECLDLSHKSSVPTDNEDMINSHQPELKKQKLHHVNNHTRKSVIQHINSTNAKSDADDAASNIQPFNMSNVSQTPTKVYEALPNLKRLSEQLKTGKPSHNQDTKACTSSKPRHGVSILNQNNTLPDADAKNKVRKGKQAIHSLKSEALSNLSQLTKHVGEDKHTVKHKLEQGTKQEHQQEQQQMSVKMPKKAESLSLKITKEKCDQFEERKPKQGRKKKNNPRSESQMPFPESSLDEAAVCTTPALNSTSEAKVKRTYIRTKLAKEKPVDMEKLMVPFEYGWRRETRLRGINKNGRMVGEVFYYTSTDKRMRSFNEVLKYLDNLRKSDEGHGSAQADTTTGLPGSPHHTDTSPNNTHHPALLNGHASREESPKADPEHFKHPNGIYIKGLNQKSKKMPEWVALQKDNFSFNAKVKLGDFLEQKPGEKYALLTDVERDQRIQTALDKRTKLMEKLSKIKLKKLGVKDGKACKQDKDKEVKQTHILQKVFKNRLKNQMEGGKVKGQLDMKDKQKELTLIVSRKMLQEAKDKDRKKSGVHSEFREKKRQSIINVKLMEIRRKEEERRRQQMEKILAKERKLELKKREMELARDLKQPVEDLQLPDLKSLPTLNRIPGMKIPACVFANILQVHQFMTTFNNCLELDGAIPTLNTFQRAILNDDDDSVDAVQKVLCHLLSFAVKDPGVPNPAQFKNEMGQKLTGHAIDEYNFSEILRQFMLIRDNRLTELSKELQFKPYSCLSMLLRSKVMVWLCDELNTSQRVTQEIEANMENVTSLKREKWELEGKIRECKQEGKLPSKAKPDNEQLSSQSDDEDDAICKSLLRQDTTSEQGDSKNITTEEKKLEKIHKQYLKTCRDVFKGVSSVRTLPYGMDRYRRYYWCLPSFNGVLVESMECSVNSISSGPNDLNLELQHITDHDRGSNDSENNTKIDMVYKDDKLGNVKDDVMSGSSSILPPNSHNDFKLDPTDSSTPVIAKSSVKTENSYPKNDIMLTPKPLHLTNQTSVSNSITSTPTHSIHSFLSCAIDNIFGVEKKHSSGSNQELKVLNTSKRKLGPDSMTCSSAQNSLPDDWFQLNRKLPCSKLSNCGPALVSSSLAFMSCVAGSEEQKELEALEALAAKNALLESRLPVPQDIQKGWWVVNDYDQLKRLGSSLHQRGIREKQLKRQLNRHASHLQDFCSNNSTNTELEFDCDERDKEIAATSYHAPVSDESQTWRVDLCRLVELRILDKVEDLEERVYQASMYTKSWADKKVHDQTDLALVVTPVSHVAEGERKIIDLVKEKLLHLEMGIERRYLKPPFIKNTELNIEDMVGNDPYENGSKDNIDDDNDDDDSINEENYSKGLLQWHRAVKEAFNLSQLYLSLQLLESCIAWEKSVMKVLCQVCRSDDNEDQLLLCDGCDKGYHTYCFKPKMTSIPDGNWYCWECKSKATSVPHCIRCGKSTGKMAQCHKCPQAIHIDCTSPPLLRVPRKHTCGHCLRQCKQDQNRSRRACQNSKKLTEDSSDLATDDEETQDSVYDCQEAQASDSEAKSDLVFCREVLQDLEKLKEAKPFLQPVDTKAFPQYKKFIKQPMDLGTISNKLDQNKYKSKMEFYADMILIFDNCLLFNEDNSDVGKSGKHMRKQFLKRWKRFDTD